MKSLVEICRSLHRVLMLAVAGSFVYLFSQQSGPLILLDETERILDNYAHISDASISRFLASGLFNDDSIRRHANVPLNSSPAEITNWSLPLGSLFAASLALAGIPTLDSQPASIEWDDELFGPVNETTPTFRDLYCVTARPRPPDCKLSGDGLGHDPRVGEIRRMLIHNVRFIDRLDLAESLRRAIVAADLHIRGANILAYSVKIHSRIFGVGFHPDPHLVFSGVVHISWTTKPDEKPTSADHATDLAFYLEEPEPTGMPGSKSVPIRSDYARLADWFERSLFKGVMLDLGLIERSFSNGPLDDQFPDPSQSTSAQAAAIWGGIASLSIADARTEINKRKSAISSDVKIFELSFVANIAGYAIPATILVLQWLLFLHVRRLPAASRAANHGPCVEMPAWIGMYADRASRLTLYVSLSVMPSAVVLWSARFNVLYEAGLIFVAAALAAASAYLGIKTVQALPVTSAISWRASKI